MTENNSMEQNIETTTAQAPTSGKSATNSLDRWKRSRALTPKCSTSNAAGKKKTKKRIAKMPKLTCPECGNQDLEHFLYLENAIVHRRLIEVIGKTLKIQADYDTTPCNDDDPMQ